MAKFITNVFGKDLESIKKEFNWVKTNQKTRPELWEIEPDKYGNRYVVLTRKPVRGRAPKLKFVRRIRTRGEGA